MYIHTRSLCACVYIYIYTHIRKGTDKYGKTDNLHPTSTLQQNDSNRGARVSFRSDDVWGLFTLRVLDSAVLVVRILLFRAYIRGKLAVPSFLKMLSNSSA